MALSANSRKDRKELDVDPFWLLILAAFLTLGIYLAIAPAEATFVRTLLFERGFTQPAALFLASLVLVFTLLKAFKLLVEAATLRKAWIPEQIALSEPNSQALINLQKSLATERSLLANRCNRVLAAYRLSGDRQVAAEVALDDASFYASASETAYALPRILVWAIPLLGFIGTVVGISQAVNGFSSFLEGAGEIDQIKEGIGVVTSGLATAFDTTFLALLLSVAVMIPLVLVERFETRLLLATDIYINDKILPRLKGKAKSDILDKDVLSEIVDEVVRERFPTPETLIEPAREYAHAAAAQLAAAFVAEVGQLQRIGSQLVAQLQSVTEAAAQDRQQFLAVLAKQPELYEGLVLDIQQFANQVKASHESIALNLTSQGETISQQLDKGAQALGNRIATLEVTTAKVTEFARLQASLDESFRSLEKAAQVEQALVELRGTLNQLQPLLHELKKQRRFIVVEQDS